MLVVKPIKIDVMNKIILLKIAFLLSSIKVNACECVPTNIESDFLKSDFVIVGTLNKILDLNYGRIQDTMPYVVNPNYIDEGGYYVSLNVSNSLKGSVPPVIIITPDWSNCDYFFKKILNM